MQKLPLGIYWMRMIYNHGISPPSGNISNRLVLERFYHCQYKTEDSDDRNKHNHFHKEGIKGVTYTLSFGPPMSPSPCVHGRKAKGLLTMRKL
jgi:hypothetical protein